MIGVLRILAAGFALGLSVAAPVGPVGAAAIREGLERGARHAFLIGLGAATVDFFYLTLVYVGVAPLLLRYPTLSSLGYLVGAGLLLHMAYGALRRALSGTLPKPAAGRTANTFLFGLGITLINPSTILSWMGLGSAFAGAYLHQSAPGEVVAALLSVFTGSLAWFSLLALFTGVARRLAGNRPWVFAAVNGTAAVALAGFAVSFLVRFAANF